MGEQLYTIPVNDAFDADCECPLCLMAKGLEQNAIEFTMGPSYMEDDNREVTDKLGFCPKHIKMMYADKNKLGVALMLNTHMNKTIREMKALAEKDSPQAAGVLARKTGGLFSKGGEKSPVVKYIEELESGDNASKVTLCSMNLDGTDQKVLAEQEWMYNYMYTNNIAVSDDYVVVNLRPQGWIVVDR